MMTNPFLKDSKIFLGYLSAWTLIFTLHVLIFYLVLELELMQCIIDALVFNSLYFILGISLWFPTQYISFENYSLVKIFFNHIAGAVITAALWIFAGYFIISKILPFSAEFMTTTLLWRFIIGIFFYLLIVSLNYILIYYKNFQEKLTKEAELNSLVKEAELKSLKYQINPHFIFNSLNSISALTLTEPTMAQEMTIKLSEFMRNTLSKNIKQKNFLSEELKSVKLYLDIEKIRFKERFDFIEEIGENCRRIEVPNMILQPLVENAIKHGVYESLDKVIIKIRCSEEKEYLKIEVENNFDQESVNGRGEGIGLSNIRNRLKLIYNRDNLLSVEKNGNIFTAKIFIPLSSKAA